MGWLILGAIILIVWNLERWGPKRIAPKNPSMWGGSPADSGYTAMRPDDHYVGRPQDGA